MYICVLKLKNIMKNFKLSEFAVSGSYPKLVEIPSGSVKNNIETLVDKLLDPIREHIGIPITITSGYRNDKLNKAVGGSPTSNHRFGYAADVVCGNRSSDNIKIVRAIFELGLSFDEVIIEKGTIEKPQWIHIAYKPSGNRSKFLFSPDGKSFVRLSAKKETTWKFVRS